MGEGYKEEAYLSSSSKHAKFLVGKTQSLYRQKNEIKYNAKEKQVNWKGRKRLGVEEEHTSHKSGEVGKPRMAC